MITSADFDWIPRDREVFIFMTHAFDINKAKAVIAKKPREIGTARTEELASILRFIRIDKKRIEDGRDIDLGVPVILAEIKTGHLPIDGWHRIAKAWHLGVPELPVVVLTKAETKRVMR